MFDAFGARTGPADREPTVRHRREHALRTRYRHAVRLPAGRSPTRARILASLARRSIGRSDRRRAAGRRRAIPGPESATASRPLSRRHVDDPVRRTPLDGIVEQVRHGPLERGRLPHHEPAVQVDLEADSGRAPPHPLDRPLDDHREIRVPRRSPRAGRRERVRRDRPRVPTAPQPEPGRRRAAPLDRRPRDLGHPRRCSEPSRSRLVRRLVSGVRNSCPRRPPTAVAALATSTPPPASR